MTARHAPPPAYPSRVWLTLMTAAVAGMIVPPTVLAAHAVAPHVAAEQHLALTPERSPEPTAHGGPLALPLIGAVTSDPPAHLPPVARTAQRPVTTVRPATQTRTASSTPKPSAVTTGQGNGTPVTTEESHVDDPTTPVGDMGTGEASSGSPTETAETPTTTETASETATETTPSDPLGDLIDDVTGTEEP